MSHIKDEPDYRDEEPIYRGIGEGEGGVEGKGEGIELTMKEIQSRIRANKVRQGFNLNDPREDLLLLFGEFGELAEAIKNTEREDLVEALLDMLVFVFGLFALFKKDGYEYIIEKMEINENREFRISERGYPVKITKNEELRIKNTDKVINLSFKELQNRIFQNKVNKGFNLDPNKLEREYVCIGEELSELFYGIRKSDEALTLESLADITIYILGLFEMMKLDSYVLLTKKMRLNEKRFYQNTGQGNFLREDQM